MLLPRTFADDWFDDFFDFDDFPFFDDKADRKMERKLYGRRARNLMKQISGRRKMAMSWILIFLDSKKKI